MQATPMRLATLAEELGLPVEGARELLVRGTAPLEEAGPADLSFVASGKWARKLAQSRAGALILPPGLDAGGRPALRSPRPRLDFARAVALLHPAPRPAPGIHPMAYVEPDARVDPSASVGPLALVGAGAEVGPRSVVHGGAALYTGVRVGADCEIHAGCVLREGTRLGDRVILQPGVVLGGDGFGYEFGEDGSWQKLPHVGGVVVEDEVEIGAGTTVDRGFLGDTWIGRGAKIDNLCQIGHNCRIGEGTIMVAQSGLAGSTIVGRRVVLMAQSGTAGHLTIGDGAFIGGRGGVHRDVPDRARIWGFPQMEERSWHRAMLALGRLPEALRRLRALERRLSPREPEKGEE